MTKLKKLHMAIVGTYALLGASAANADIGLKAGNWDLSFSGNVNGFATWNNCDNTATVVAGGLACNQGPGNPDVQSVESGLLPSALVFSAKTVQSGLDVGFTIGFYPGLRTSPGAGSGNQALGNSQINVRQNFLTFGQKSWGTIKVGRDLGLFGSDAILSDMTLLGAGSGAAFLGGSTTLGRIGVGYIYADWIPQITYISPNVNGFQVSGGLFQSFDQVNFAGDPNSPGLTGHDRPAFQLKASYEWKGNMGGKLWAGYMNQQNKARTGNLSTAGGAIPAGTSITGDAWELGGKVSAGGFEGVLYGYTGKGVGTTAIGFNGASWVGGSLQKRDSDGWYIQATYKFGAPKLGLSYGESKLKLAGNESSATNPTLVDRNRSWVGGVYYSLTQNLNLVAEYIQTKARNQAGGEVKDNAVAVGAILFF